MGITRHVFLCTLMASIASAQNGNNYGNRNGNYQGNNYANGNSGNYGNSNYNYNNNQGGNQAYNQQYMNGNDGNRNNYDAFDSQYGNIKNMDNYNGYNGYDNAYDYNGQDVQGLNKNYGNFQYNSYDATSYEERQQQMENYMSGYRDNVGNVYNGKYYYSDSNPCYQNFYGNGDEGQDQQNQQGQYQQYQQGQYQQNQQGQYQQNQQGQDYEEQQVYQKYQNYLNCVNQNNIYDNKSIRITNCPRSIVQVTAMQILCSNTNTWYDNAKANDYGYNQYSHYGYGSHQMKTLCLYGDHALVTVFFEVEEDLGWNEDIFMTLAIYAPKGNKELIWAVRSVELCATFVGHDCQQKGQYAFAFRVKLGWGSGNDDNLFVPAVEMGFSTRADEGYNLGGVNIYCKFNGRYQQYDPWFNGAKAREAKTWAAGNIAGKAASHYGLYVGGLLYVFFIAIYAYTRMWDQTECSEVCDYNIEDSLHCDDD